MRWNVRYVRGWRWEEVEQARSKQQRVATGKISNDDVEEEEDEDDGSERWL
jgi:hypothetical protein